MKATDLRAKSVDELNAELIELRRAQFSAHAIGHATIK